MVVLSTQIGTKNLNGWNTLFKVMLPFVMRADNFNPLPTKKKHIPKRGIGTRRTLYIQKMVSQKMKIEIPKFT
jgi:hypothetical protein